MLKMSNHSRHCVLLTVVLMLLHFGVQVQRTASELLDALEPHLT